MSTWIAKEKIRLVVSSRQAVSWANWLGRCHVTTGVLYRGACFARRWIAPLVGRGRLCRRALVINRPADTGTTAQAICNDVPEERCRSARRAVLTNGCHERL